MGLAKSVSSDDGVVLLEFETMPHLERCLQDFFTSIGISKAKRKNLYRGLIGINRIGLGRKGIENYSDTVQVLKTRDVTISVFTGRTKVFVVLHFLSEEMPDNISDAIALLLK